MPQTKPQPQSNKGGIKSQLGDLCHKSAQNPSYAKEACNLRSRIGNLAPLSRLKRQSHEDHLSEVMKKIDTFISPGGLMR